MEFKDILFDVIERIENNTPDSIKTGFNDIDALLSGTEKGSLVVIGGRPSMGKTCFMTSVLENLLNDGHRYIPKLYQDKQ